MKQLWRFAAISLGPGAALFLAFVGYMAFDVYVRGNCDPKFGCFGSIHFTGFITGLMLICSLSGHLIACLVFHRTVRFLSSLWLFGVVIALSLGQGALAASMEWLLPGDSVISMMAAWAAISCGIALGVLYLVRLCPPNNSFKAMPLRGTP